MYHVIGDVLSLKPKILSFLLSFMSVMKVRTMIKDLIRYLDHQQGVRNYILCTHHFGGQDLSPAKTFGSHLLEDPIKHGPRPLSQTFFLGGIKLIELQYFSFGGAVYLFIFCHYSFSYGI